VVYELVPNGTRYTYHVIYKFCTADGSLPCKNGYSPLAPLIQDVNGNLYGATSAGGNRSNGRIFELVMRPDGKSYGLVTLYDFCAGGTGCPDGASPNGLTYQGQQNGEPYDGTSPLFGTTQHGGRGDGGVAFRLGHASGQTARKEQVIYTFCAQAGCPDGETPSRLTVDASGRLFGTTQSGGSGNDLRGTVFQLTPRRGGFLQTVLYNFCSLPSCADGENPWASVVQDSAGNLFGTTRNGGSNNSGIVFRINPKGANSRETVLYSFCNQASCVDGAQPLSEVILDSEGNIFGFTQVGAFGGVAFELSGQRYTVLHTFCTTEDCTDGAWPSSAPMLDPSGNLFGTALKGGSNNEGTVFKLRLPGAQ
jgi:uncharacterized repeat protein (TIGR03803 family)